MLEHKYQDLFAIAPDSDFTIKQTEGGCVITDYQGPGGYVAIPETIDGKPVVKLWDGAFQNCDTLTGLFIPACVTEIDDDWHFKNPSLEGIFVAAENPVYFSHSGVLYCRKTDTLMRFPAAHPDREYAVQERTREIGESAFESCEGLAYLSIPESVRFLDRHAFADVEQMTVRICGAGNLGMSEYLFSESDYNPFDYGDIDFTFLTARFSKAHVWARLLDVSCSFQDGFSTERIVEKDRRNGTFLTDKSIITKYDGPGGAVVIPEIIDLGSAWTYLGNVYRENPYYSPEKDYGKYGVYYEDMDEHIHYCTPLYCGKIGDRAFADCDTVTSVEIPETVTAIGREAFSGCTALGRVFVPSSVTEIGQNAFDGCPDLILAVKEHNYGHRYAVSNGIAFVLLA